MKNKRTSNYSKEKALIPYDYMDYFERLSETTSPPIESFYSELNKSGISEDNYTHAQKVEMETLPDYHDIYLKTLEMFVKRVMDWIQLGTIQLQVLHGTQL